MNQYLIDETTLRLLLTQAEYIALFHSARFMTDTGLARAIDKARSLLAAPPFIEEVVVTELPVLFQVSLPAPL